MAVSSADGSASAALAAAAFVYFAPLSYGLEITRGNSYGPIGFNIADMDTALARADDRKRALASGFQEHVAKPYSVAQLVSAVRSVLAEQRR